MTKSARAEAVAQKNKPGPKPAEIATDAITPAIQLALLSASVLRGRNAASFALALGTVTLLAALAFYSGAFNFY